MHSEGSFEGSDYPQKASVREARLTGQNARVDPSSKEKSLQRQTTVGNNRKYDLSSILAHCRSQDALLHFFGSDQPAVTSV